jgi:enoyl-CoA hydratase
MSELLVLTEIEGNVGIVRLNRPKARNALSAALILQLLDVLKKLDADDQIGAIVLNGGDVFCAGADIKELKDLNFTRAYMGNFLQNLNDGIASIGKPILAAVTGYALGGGCELAMMCDVIYAAEGSFFGQPEIKIGTIAGAGGSQRLTRAIGKAKAMHMCLTGDTMDAKEAEAAGLVAKVLPKDQVLKFVIETAQKIASYSAPVVRMAKESVNQAEELNLENGLRFERRLYHATFGLADSTEGMNAFVEKRQPKWAHK